MAKYDSCHIVGGVESGPGSHTVTHIQTDGTDRHDQYNNPAKVDQSISQLFQIIHQIWVTGNTLWIVSLKDTTQIKEHFMGFLVAAESTRGRVRHLSSSKDWRSLNIPFEDCRGKSYDSGANKKGKNKGVQVRLIRFFILSHVVLTREIRW